MCAVQIVDLEEHSYLQDFIASATKYFNDHPHAFFFGDQPVIFNHGNFLALRSGISGEDLFIVKIQQATLFSDCLIWTGKWKRLVQRQEYSAPAITKRLIKKTDAFLKAAIRHFKIHIRGKWRLFETPKRFKRFIAMRCGDEFGNSLMTIVIDKHFQPLMIYDALMNFTGSFNPYKLTIELPTSALPISDTVSPPEEDKSQAPQGLTPNQPQGASPLKGKGGAAHGLPLTQNPGVATTQSTGALS